MEANIRSKHKFDIVVAWTNCVNERAWNLLECDIAPVQRVETNEKYKSETDFDSHIVNPSPVLLRKHPTRARAKSEIVKNTIIEDGSDNLGRSRIHT